MKADTRLQMASNTKMLVATVMQQVVERQHRSTTQQSTGCPGWCRTAT